MFREGELIPPRLAAAFPHTSSVALSFQLFGVGIWQGRLPGVVYMLLALVMLAVLAWWLYRPSVAVGALVLLLLLTPHPLLHPVFVGRQVLAEQLMLALLLAGYVALFASLRFSSWYLFGAIALWGLALMTKAQPLPFWAASLLVPLGVALLRRAWYPAVLLGVALLGALIASRLFGGLFYLIVQPDTSQTPTEGLYTVTAFVLEPHVRIKAFTVLLFFGVPTLVGLLYSFGRWLRPMQQDTAIANPARWVVQLALLAMVGSWLAWYLLFSIAWERYFFPALFMGSIFVAAALDDLVRRGITTLQQGSAPPLFRHWQTTPYILGGLILVVSLLGLSPFYIHTQRAIFRSGESNTAILQVADYLNTRTSPNALIESYDSELFFFLDRPYHFPPNEVHVLLNRRTFLDQDLPIDYDPLSVDPDYLVVGGMGKLWGLYDEVLESAEFRHLRSYRGYDIYERVR
jgi:hypothetical protein